MRKNNSCSYLAVIIFIFAITVLLAIEKSAFADFIIQNAAGEDIFRIYEDSGDVTNFGRGSYDMNSAQLPPGTTTVPVGWESGFEVRNNAGEIVFYVENNGNVHMAGMIQQDQAGGGNPLTPPAGNNFIVQNNAGQTVAFISNSGDLNLSGFVVAVGDDTIRFAFVTNDTWFYTLYSGNLEYLASQLPYYFGPGVLAGDTLCNYLSALAGLPYSNVAEPRYRAWLSQWNNYAINRLNHMDNYQFVAPEKVSPYSGRLLLISNGLPFNPISGVPNQYLMNTIDRDQDGNPITSDFIVQTGTHENGVGEGTVISSFDCSEWNGALPGYVSIRGDLREKDKDWTEKERGNLLCHQEESRLYCFCQAP